MGTKQGQFYGETPQMGLILSETKLSRPRRDETYCLLGLVSAPQMALLGYLPCDKYSCWSIVCVCEREREREHVAGVHKRIGCLKYLVVSGFEPWPPAWQASGLSVALYPSG